MTTEHHHPFKPQGPLFCDVKVWLFTKYRNSVHGLEGLSLCLVLIVLCNIDVFILYADQYHRLLFVSKDTCTARRRQVKTLRFRHVFALVCRGASHPTSYTLTLYSLSFDLYPVNRHILRHRITTHHTQRASFAPFLTPTKVRLQVTSLIIEEDVEVLQYMFTWLRCSFRFSHPSLPE